MSAPPPRAPAAPPSLDFAGQMRALDRCSGQRARALHAAGRRFRLRDLLWRPPLRFAAEYALRGRFRRGVRGLVESASAAYAVFVTYGKLWELERGPRS